MPSAYEEIESLLSSEEKIETSIKNYLTEHIKKLSEKTGKTTKELQSYIDRLVVM